jgi:hypothetical protein
LNCRKCEADLSAYIDGELDPRASREVAGHLATCAGCREKEAGLERVAGMLAALPRAGLSEVEQRQLMEGLRRRMKDAEAAERRRRASLFPRVATATAILVTVVVVTIALMATPTSRKAAEPTETPVADATGLAPQDGVVTGGSGNNGAVASGAGESAEAPSVTSLATASLLPTPRMVKSSNDYDKSQVAEYSADLGTRLDFYSDLWYRPAPYSGASVKMSGADQSAIQEHYVSELTGMAAEWGEDPESLKKSLSLASSQIPPGKFAVPCFAERAFYQGQPVWIISYSVPEDSQLFTNPEVASLVSLAKQLFASGNLQDDALMEMLAATIAPGGYASVSTAQRSALGTSADLDLQALIASLAENNNLATYLRQLSELDSEKLLSLISGMTSYPIQISSELLDTLTWHVWVVNPDTGQILSRPSR